jgi:hypothetical protein
MCSTICEGQRTALHNQKEKHMISTKTLEQSIGACSLMKPEWLRIPDAIRVSGIGRSTLYSLLTSGSIKSALIRKRGCQRGIRLISTDSLRAYIESCVSKGGNCE